MADMKPKVYIETTVVSYLAARPSRDVVIAGHQQVTHEWWQSSRERFELVTSQMVVQEASAGDSEAAQARSVLLIGLTLLEATEEAVDLAQRLLQESAIPAQYPEDALHVAIAAVNGIEYLLTWNYRHLANAVMRNKIEAICLAAGYEPTTICTPDELMET
jgi:predicted nucleic acid-binding protein